MKDHHQVFSAIQNQEDETNRLINEINANIESESQVNDDDESSFNPDRLVSQIDQQLGYTNEDIQIDNVKYQQQEQIIKQLQEQGQEINKLIAENKKIRIESETNDNLHQKINQQSNEMEEEIKKLEEENARLKKIQKELKKDEKGYDREQENNQEIGEEFKNPDQEMEQAALTIQGHFRKKQQRKEKSEGQGQKEQENAVQEVDIECQCVNGCVYVFVL